MFICVIYQSIFCTDLRQLCMSGLHQHERSCVGYFSCLKEFVGNNYGSASRRKGVLLRAGEHCTCITFLYSAISVLQCVTCVDLKLL